MRRLLLALIMLVYASAAAAQPKISALMGWRGETDSTEVWPAIGVGADFGSYRWRVRPEAGVSWGFDPFNSGDERELFAGAVTYWHLVRTRLHLGGGVSDMTANWGPNDGSSSG